MSFSVKDNIQRLISMGVRLAPSSVEQFLSIDESYSGGCFWTSPREINMSISRF